MRIIELNKVQGIRNSSDKLLMKRAFREAGIKTAQWWTTNDGRTFVENENGARISINDLPYPVVLKSRLGSRGRGNTLCRTQEDFTTALRGKNLNDYIIEKFYNYNREYRLHVNKNGYFYTCRKVLKQDTPENQRWFRNDSNSSWLLEENPSFDKPNSFKDIEKDCVKALETLGLDFAAFDVRVQSSKDNKGRSREKADYIIIESNSAPSFGDRTLEEYKKMIPQLINS